MPAIVDHAARRAELARIAADVIAAEGVEGATVRAIAGAAGFSTKVVSHYFPEKRALLLMTYRFAAADSAESAAAKAGPADARAYALSLLPTRPEMVRNWKVWLAFWGFAISDAEFAEEQRGQVLAACAQVATRLSHDPAFAHLLPRERKRAARELVTTVIGVALQAAFDPKTWSTKRQTEAVLDRLETYLNSKSMAVARASPEQRPRKAARQT